MTKLHLDGKKNNFYCQKIELRLWRDITFKNVNFVFCLISETGISVAQLRVFKLFQTLLLYQWIWKQLESSLILKESCFFAHSIMNIKGVLNWTAWFDYSSTSCILQRYKVRGEGVKNAGMITHGANTSIIMHRFIKLVVSTTFITSTVNKIWY